MKLFTPRARGVKITIVAISPKCDAQSSSPFGSPLVYLFKIDWQPSCAAALISLTLGAMNAFLTLSYSHMWYVAFNCTKRYSRVKDVVDG